MTSTRERRESDGRGVDIERLASGLFGAAILSVGVRRRSVGGFALAIVGADVLYHGITGRPGMLARALGAAVHGSEYERVGAAAETPDVERTIMVRSDAQTLYQLWRDPQQLARLFGRFAEVTRLSEDRALWRVRGPMGRELE